MTKLVDMAQGRSFWNYAGTTADAAFNASGSWLQDWRNALTAKQKPIPNPLTCMVHDSHGDCTRNDLVGGHVRIQAYNDTKYYIIPICRGHNAVSMTTAPWQCKMKTYALDIGHIEEGHSDSDGHSTISEVGTGSTASDSSSNHSRSSSSSGGNHALPPGAAHKPAAPPAHTNPATTHTAPHTAPVLHKPAIVSKPAVSKPIAKPAAAKPLVSKPIAAKPGVAHSAGAAKPIHAAAPPKR